MDPETPETPPCTRDARRQVAGRLLHRAFTLLFPDEPPTTGALVAAGATALLEEVIDGERRTAPEPPTITRVCRTCRTLFQIDANQQRWFRQRLLRLPRRCEPCRRLTRGEAS